MEADETRGEKTGWEVLRESRNWIRRGESMSWGVKKRRKERLIAAYRTRTEDTHKEAEDKVSKKNLKISGRSSLGILSLLVQKNKIRHKHKYRRILSV